jgi:hypothetical protein
VVDAQRDDALNVGGLDLAAALKRDKRLGSAVDDNVAAQTVDIQARADVRDEKLRGRQAGRQAGGA